MQGCGKNKEEGQESRKIVLTTGFQDEELFRIDSDSCFAYEAIIYIANINNQYKKLYGNEFLTASVNGIYPSNDINNQVLAKITKVKVMDEMAGNYLVGLDDSDHEIIAEAAAEYYNGLTAADRQALGITNIDAIIKMYEEYRLAEKVYEYIVKDTNPEISDDEARTMIVKQIYFNSNGLSDLEKSQLLNRANEVKKKAMDGEDFDSLAAANSDNEQVNYSYTKLSIDQKLKDKAFELSKDEISDVMEGEAGYYIILCVDPFDRAATDTTKEAIIKDKKLEVFESSYNRFAKDRRCYFNDEVWKEITSKDYSDIETAGFFDIYYNYF